MEAKGYTARKDLPDTVHFFHSSTDRTYWSFIIYTNYISSIPLSSARPKAFKIDAYFTFILADPHLCFFRATIETMRDSNAEWSAQHVYSHLQDDFEQTNSHSTPPQTSELPEPESCITDCSSRFVSMKRNTQKLLKLIDFSTCTSSAYVLEIQVIICKP